MIFRKSILLLLAAVGFMFTACDKGIETTESGIEYRIHNEQEGETAKEGDAMEFHMLIRTEKDSVLSDSRVEGKPIFVPLQKAPYPGSIQEALFLLAKGDSADIFINVDSLLAREGGQRPPFLPAGSKIKYTVKVYDLVSKEEFIKKMQKRGEEAALQEDVDLKAYLAKNAIAPLKTASGLLYVVEKQTNGNHPKVGDTVAVHYTGTLLSGKPFDSSIGREPFEFILGKGMVIPGWDEGIQLMKKGEKFKFYIPSNLAYGQEGAPRGGIAPFSTLVFEVELLDQPISRP